MKAFNKNISQIPLFGKPKPGVQRISDRAPLLAADEVTDSVRLAVSRWSAITWRIR
jgi:hypothetical protein